MKDFANKEYLDDLKDQARFEVGTQVQFFEFSDITLMKWITVLTSLMMFNYWTELININIAFSFFIGAYVMLIVFYLKYGTK